MYFIHRFLVVVLLVVPTESYTTTVCKQPRRPCFLNQMSMDINELFEGDVIVLEEANGRPKSLVAVTATKKTLQPLCVRSSSGVEELEEGSIHDIVLYEDEECEPIAMDTVILNADAVVEDVVFTQRCVEDRVTNPHGEHAEGIWGPFPLIPTISTLIPNRFPLPSPSLADVWIVSDPKIIASIWKKTIYLPRR